MKQRLIEILAPARDLVTGLAAIDCGADAVYIGPSKFGARTAAANNVGDIKKLCEYAHFFNAKVYIALNTILRDGELAEAQTMVFELYDAGADALIIQDMGFLEIEMPPIPLFASTQMDNVTLDKVKFLEDVGFDRVILARELSLEQIALIRRSVTVDLEFFVHGSLCVCYSGQCYMSMASTGRSANRGECSQPCRLPYELSDKNGNILSSGKHLLSLKDLNLSEKLEDLIGAGISSFKIEGRLKDTEHVSNVTAYYRKRLDAILTKDQTLKKASSGTILCKFDPDPAKTFNRGFTTYMLTGEREPFASLKTPKFVGEPVGKVKKVFGDRIEVESQVAFLNGDGLSYFNDNGVLTGFNVNKTAGHKLYPHKMPRISVGTELYRNFDKRFMDRLKTGCERRVEVDFNFSETEHGFLLVAQDEDGHKAEVELSIPKVPAEKVNNAERGLRDSLSKTGKTAFQMRTFISNTTKAYFIRTSEINGMRRDVLEKLTALRNVPRKSMSVRTEKEGTRYPESELDFHGNVMNQKAKEFYQRHGTAVVQTAFEKLSDMEGLQVMTTKHCLKFESGGCKSKGGTQDLPEGPFFLKDAGQTYRVEFDCIDCVMKIFFLNRRK